MFEALVEKLTGRCRFRRGCGLYYRAAFTCNEAAGPYCGKYRAFSRERGDQ